MDNFFYFLHSSFSIFMAVKSFFSELTLCVKPCVALNGEMHLHILSL